MEIETWWQVTNYPNYAVSDNGRVANISQWPEVPKILKPHLSRGYYRVELSENGKPKKFQVHRLVLLVFVGPAREGQQGNHKNGIKTDNRLSNLEYVTRSENGLHACRVLNTHKQKGSKHGRHKLKEKDAIDIYAMAVFVGIPQADIAKQFNVSVPTVSMIANKRTWKHIH